MKRVGAILGIVLLISMYLTTLVCALIKTDTAFAMLKASIFFTFFIPVILYVYMMTFKFFNKDAAILDELELNETKDEEATGETSEESKDSSK
ncbi:MAG: hypothetical protein K6C69_04185 [Lachnospiraceae bacterium]|nr:hypothetical protein [Lachnospiraceae bacterium]